MAAASDSASSQLSEQNGPQDNGIVISETREHFHNAHTLLLDTFSSGTVEEENSSKQSFSQDLFSQETNECSENSDVNVFNADSQDNQRLNTIDFAVNVLGVTPCFSLSLSEHSVTENIVTENPPFDENACVLSDAKTQTHDPNLNSHDNQTNNTADLVANALGVTHHSSQFLLDPVDGSQDLFQEPNRDCDVTDTNIVSSTPIHYHTTISTNYNKQGCSNPTVKPCFSASQHIITEYVSSEDTLHNENRPVLGEDETRDPNYTPNYNAEEEEECNASMRTSDEPSSPAGIVARDDGPPVVEACEADKTRPGRSTQRKRVRDEVQWKVNVRKRRRNHGEEYFTRKGKAMEHKSLDDTPCGCRKQCNNNVKFEARKELFHGFWNLGDWSAQNSYLVGLIKVNAIKQRDNRDRRGRTGVEGPILPKKAQRKFTREYNVQNSSGVTTAVCKKFFLDTFKISNGRLDRASQTANTHKGPRADQRGRKEPKNKTPLYLIEELRKFITDFPKYESHYCRENGQSVSTGRMYFGPGLKVAILFKLYSEECMSNSRPSVSDPIFRKVLKKDFKLSFHLPLKDTCKTCDIFKVDIAAAIASKNTEKINELRNEREQHHLRAEQVGKQIKEDKQKPNTKVISFDLQKTLPTPVLTTNVVYYKRQLWTYNLGIHDEQSGKAFMCMWHEGQASRGPNEIGSCLIKYIKENDIPTNLIAYTDTCGGQNRNIKICLFWLYVVNDESNNVEVVDQKFYVSGHSYMSCDRDFGKIEQQKPNHPYIFLPGDWVKLVTNASKKFRVIDMSSDDIVHVEQLLKSIVHRKADVNGEKVEWLRIQWLRFRKECPFKIFFKYSLNEEVPFRCLDIGRRTQREGRPSIIPVSDPLPQLYPNGRPIKPAKFNDIQSLFPYIPSVHHAFYNSLLREGTHRADDGNDDIMEMEVDETQ